MVYLDELNIELWEDKGFAQLERFYGDRADYIPYEVGAKCKSPNVVAKGISAYLSYESWSVELRYKSLRWQIRDVEPLTHERIFARYFNVCISHTINENNKKDLWDRLTEEDLIKAHLETEKDYLQDSGSLFKEFREYEEDDMRRLLSYAEYYIKWVKTTKLRSSHNNEENDRGQGSTKEKDHKITAPVIALFCSWVDRAIEQIGERSVSNYCLDICKRYNLNYSDRVRQNFRTSDTPKNRQKVKDLILSHIDDESQKQIEEYINTKYNLYG